MTDKAGKYLYDIRHAIDLIESFMESTADFNAYQPI